VFIKALLMIAIGALIGWITNYFAIKMLFRPRQEKNILGFKIQGLIPKRKKEIAKSIAETVDEELISMSDITKTINSMEIEGEIDGIVSDIVDGKIKKDLMQKIPMIELFLNDELLEKIKEMVKSVIEKHKGVFVEKIVHKLEEEVDIKAMVEEKINEFSLDELEKMTYKIADNELKHIEFIGAVLGAIIGGIQFIISIYL